jgi:hypothetical protein
LGSALEADEILQSCVLQQPDFRERISRLEVLYCVEFAPAAMAFVRKWFLSLHAFSIHVLDSEWTEMLAIMIYVGFFQQTGARYQMTVPKSINITAITTALLRLASTEDAEYDLHPEDQMTTINRQEAETSKVRLNRISWEQRVADRESLLDDG